MKSLQMPGFSGHVCEGVSGRLSVGRGQDEGCKRRPRPSSFASSLIRMAAPQRLQHDCVQKHLNWVSGSFIVNYLFCG